MKFSEMKGRFFGAILVLGLAGGLSGITLARDAQDCRALRDHVMDGAYVTSARVMTSDALVEYCEVRATARPAISIEVRLPLEAWNGKFYQVGCGGFCGDLGRADRIKRSVNAMGPGLEKGYATATSDGGHHGLDITDASWAYNNPPAERDWGGAPSVRPIASLCRCWMPSMTRNRKTAISKAAPPEAAWPRWRR